MDILKKMIFQQGGMEVNNDFFQLITKFLKVFQGKIYQIIHIYSLKNKMK